MSKSTCPDLQDLREKLLAPRAIVRDENGHLTHPDLPTCDEGVRYDDLLAVFGIESAFVGMESDAPHDVSERYFDSGDPDCSYWTPTPPDGDGWMLLEIYDTEDGPYALFGRAMPDAMYPRRGGKPFDFYAHLERQAEFSRKTFGPGRRTQGVIDHIKKELREIGSKPDDIEEWIDVVILALDGAWRAGASPKVIIRTLVAKQAKNEARDWPDWRTADPNKAIEHSKTKKRRIYISGPMSGLPEHNFPAFHEESARLRDMGYDVVNPADLNPDPGKDWKDCLRIDLLELLGCDAIAMLPGWQKSEGAHLEMHVAHRVGIDIVDSGLIQAEADEAPAFYIACFARRFHDGLVVWWRPDAKGYTTDLAQAGRYTKSDAEKHANEDNVVVPASWVRDNCRIRQCVDYGDSHHVAQAFWEAKNLRSALAA